MSSLFIFFTFLNLLYISSFKGFTCKKLSFTNDVRIWPESCVLYDQRYGSICSFSCANGKQISGPSSVRCGIRGYWSEEVNEVSCNGSYNSNFCLLRPGGGVGGQKSLVYQNFAPQNNYIWNLYPPPPPLAMAIFKMHTPTLQPLLDQVSSSILGHWFH